MSVTVVRSVEVEASPEQVWKVLGDFASISSWAPNVDHSCLMDSPATDVGVARRIQSGRTMLIETVVAWDPPTTLSYTLTGLPQVVRSASNTWHVFALGEKSRVSLMSIVDGGSRPPGQLAARVVCAVMAKASDQMLTGLGNQLLANESEVGS